MAFERYTTKSGRLFVLLRTWHITAKALYDDKKLVHSPATVELLDVNAEKSVEVKYVDFQSKIAEGTLKRIEP